MPAWAATPHADMSLSSTAQERFSNSVMMQAGAPVASTAFQTPFTAKAMDGRKHREPDLRVRIITTVKYSSDAALETMVAAAAP